LSGYGKIIHGHIGHPRKKGDPVRLAVILPAETTRTGGVQRFGSELTQALSDCAQVATFRVHPEPGAGRVGALLSGAAALRAAHRRAPFDAVLTTFHWPPRLWSVPTYGVIHDLRPWREGSRRQPHLVAQRAICATWSVVLVPSTHVAEDVRTLLGRPAVVIGEGADHLPPGPASATRDRIVVLGGGAPHKRTELATAAAVRAAAVLGCRPPLVIGGAAQRISGAEYVESPDDSTLAGLLATGRVAVTATSYEGFGLAVAEALHAGAPVAWCRDGTLAQLVDGGGLASDPDERALSEAVVRLWQEGRAPSDRARAAVADRTWRTVAVDVANLVRSRS
jgi:glycosyltransferase involved in cell wall biosynthesis